MSVFDRRLFSLVGGFVAAGTVSGLVLAAGIGVRRPLVPPLFSIDVVSPDIGAPIRQADILTPGGGTQPTVVIPASRFVQQPLVDELDGLSTNVEGPTLRQSSPDPNPSDLSVGSFLLKSKAVRLDAVDPAATIERLTGNHVPDGWTAPIETPGGLRGDCPVQCQPGDIVEFEPNCGLPTDNINGGCNSNPLVAPPIVCDQSHCGSFAFDGVVRDTDWFELIVPGAPGTQTDVTITAVAESQFHAGFALPLCNGFFDASIAGDACQTVSFTKCYAAGSLVYVVILPAFAGVIPCGDPSLGDWRLTVTCAPGNCPVPGNDNCDAAISVAVPSGTFGATVDATADLFAPSPCGTPVSAPGVWYTVAGTGNTLTASLCNGFTTYDTQLNVYCGSCGSLSCIGGNDDTCGLQSQVSWCSTAGEIYYVLVQGFGGQTGPFQLVVSDDGVACVSSPCNEHFVIMFSVDRASVGAVGPDPTLLPTFPFNVQEQAAKNQAAGDMFMTLHLYTRAGPILPPSPLLSVPGRNNTMVRNHGDAGGNDFNVQPDAPLDSPAAVVPGGTPITDGDSAMGTEEVPLAGAAGLRRNGARGAPQPFFFSLRAGSPSLPLYPGATPGGSGADIIYDSNPNAPFPSGESTYARAAQLGLVPADDLDDIIVWDDGVLQSGFPVYNPVSDQVLFTLARNSPSAGADGPAAIFTTNAGGGFQLFSQAANLGLLVSDNVDMLDFVRTESILTFIQDHAVGYVCLCPNGDADCDNTVDLTDLAILLSSFGGANSDVDFDNNSIVDLADLSMLLALFGSNCEPD